MIQPDHDLSKLLNQIGPEFRPNELAYLATTTKAQGPFRDRLAFLLHKNYEPSGFTVAREWNRVDIAIVAPNDEPVCLIELKAMYSFDAVKDVAFFTAATTADELKAQRLAKTNTAVYSLLLMTHLGGCVQKPFLKPVKYSRKINQAVERYGSADTLLTMARAAVEVDLRHRNVAARGTVDSGSAFGLAVSIAFWLVRNDRH